MLRIVALATLALLVPPVAATSPRQPTAPEPPGGRIPSHFVGLSIEWSLVERYMGPEARPVFANLLRNLGTGVLRIGGDSQDLMPFAAGTRNTRRVITPEDVVSVRTTLDAADAAEPTAGAPSWGVILGTAMAPPSATRPWVSRGNARDFLRQGVRPAFRGAGERYVAGIEFGNEPDVSYRSDAGRYARDLAAYADPRVRGRFAVVGPNTSETIAPWTTDARSFWDEPRILETVAHAGGGPFGAFATSHFYPTARDCGLDSYRCSTRARLLSDERMANFDHQVHARAREAARHDLAYRVEEMNSASGRGVQGVSNVAASAAWALDTMFHAACPQPPSAPGANADCRTGAIGVNFHNAEVEEFFDAEDGNAYYNAIRYDATSAVGPPRVAPQYYAMLMFARFAQGTDGLRPVNVAAPKAVNAWRVDAGSERRVFLINKGHRRAAVAVPASGSTYQIHRVPPDDPGGAGRTVGASGVRN